MFNTLILALATDEELLEHYFSVNSSVRERIVTHLQKRSRAKIEDILQKPGSFKMSDIRRIFSSMDGNPDAFYEWVASKRSVAYHHEKHARRLTKDGGEEFDAFLAWAKDLNESRARAVLQMLSPSDTCIRHLLPEESSIGDPEVVINLLKEHKWMIPDPPYHYMRDYEDIDKARAWEVNFPLKREPDPDDPKKRILHYVGVYLVAPGEFGVWKDTIIE